MPVPASQRASKAQSFKKPLLFLKFEAHDKNLKCGKLKRNINSYFLPFHVAKQKG